MSVESEQNPFEPRVWVEDNLGQRHLVRESEVETFKAEQEEVSDIQEEDIEEKDFIIPQKKSGMTRRGFLSLTGGAALAGVAWKTGLLNEEENDLEESFIDTENPRPEKKERLPVPVVPIEQFVKYGKIKNLHTGIEAIQSEHFRHLTKEPSGIDDMKMAVENMQGLDMPRFTQPFRDKGLPTQLCYMIAIQETRGRNITSWAGAKGMMGIIPWTAGKMVEKITEEEKIDIEEIDLHDPYFASKIAAYYCSEEAKAFDSGDMILYAYNKGRGLFGFTAQTPKEERTPENFYTYMEEEMNSENEQLERQGYFLYKVRENDTIYKLVRRFGTTEKKINTLNGIGANFVLKEDSEIKLPYAKTKPILSYVFRKEFETLRYTPEVKAKYEVLKHQGLLAKLENGLQEKASRNI